MGMIVNGDQVNNATLNSLMGFDAVVSSSVATTTGRIYPTVADAMAAGRRAILVQPGNYASGFTVTASGTRIVGLQRVTGISGSAVSGGAKFGGKITIAANYVRLEHLAVSEPGDDCFLVDSGSDVLGTIAHCVGVGASGDYCGVRINGAYATQVIGCNFYANANGIKVTPDAIGSTWTGIILRDNWIWQNRMSGILLEEFGGDTTTNRQVLIEGNTIRDCCTSGGAGIYVENAHNARIIGNEIYSNGDGDTDANGIYVVKSNSNYRQSIIGNIIQENTGYGIALSASTYGAYCSIVGNNVRANGIGGLSNVANCPGYAAANTNTV